jgi:hypothetical protein
MAKRIPIIGKWYQDAEEDVLFEVVAVDEHTASIEVQYEDGEVGEFDLETWMQMIVLPAKAPEDWRVSYELDDDVAADDDIFIPEHFDDPLDGLEADSFYGLDDF